MEKKITGKVITIITALLTFIVVIWGGLFLDEATHCLLPLKMSQALLFYISALCVGLIILGCNIARKTWDCKEDLKWSDLIVPVITNGIVAYIALGNIVALSRNWDTIKRVNLFVSQSIANDWLTGMLVMACLFLLAQFVNLINVKYITKINRKEKYVRN